MTTSTIVTDRDATLQKWLTSEFHIHLTSGADMAAALRLVAEKLDEIGDVAPTWMAMSFQPAGSDPKQEAARRAAVDSICAALGMKASAQKMSGGSWHYQHSYEGKPGSFSVLTGMEPPNPELLAALAENERLRARLTELTAPTAVAVMTPDDPALPAEPDESEYAVATDKTWLSAVTGDVPGEVVHAIDAVGNNASGWYWSCRCGEGGFELAAREYAQREAGEHLYEVGTRVFTAKPPFVAQTVHALGVNGSHDDPYPCGAEGGAGSFLIRDVTCTGCLAADSPAEAGVAPESGTAVA